MCLGNRLYMCGDEGKRARGWHQERLNGKRPLKHLVVRRQRGDFGERSDGATELQPAGEECDGHGVQLPNI